MKLATMIQTEIRFIMSMGRMPFLIMIYPIILMLIIGPAFSSSLNNTSNVPVAVYDNEDGANQAILDGMKDVAGVSVIYASSEKDLAAAVISGAAPLGVVLGSDEHGQYITFYRDPSKGVISTNVIMALETSFNEKKGVSVTGKLSGMRSSLANAARFLSNGMETLGEAKSDIVAIKQDVNDIGSRAAALNMGQVQLELGAMANNTEDARRNMSDMRLYLQNIQAESAQIDQTINKIDAASALLLSTRNDLSSFDSKRSSYIGKIDNAISKLSSYNSRLSQADEMVELAKASTSDPNTLSYLQQIDSQISQARTDVAGAQNDLYSARSDISSVNTAQYSSNIDNARSDLASTRSQLIALRTRILTDATDWRARLGIMEGKLNDASGSISELSGELEKMDALSTRVQSISQEISVKSGAWLSGIESANSDAGEITRDLSVLAGTADIKNFAPARISTNDVIKNTNMLNLFFPAIIGVDMVLATLLLPMAVGVSLKDQGMDRRILDSRMGSFNFVFGRFAAHYLISLFQLAVLVGFALVFFNVGNLQSLPAVAIVLLLTPAVFTALGVLLSLFVRKESAAVLLSLVIGIPSIFLSSGIVPSEFFPQLFQYAGKATPLYHMTDAISKALIRGLGASEIFANVAYMLCFVILCLAVAYFTRKHQE